MTNNKKPRKKYVVKTYSALEYKLHYSPMIDMQQVSVVLEDLSILKTLVSRGFLSQTPVKYGNTNYPNEFVLLGIFFQQIFFFQWLVKDKGKKKFFIKLREHIVRYFDKVICQSEFEEERQVYLMVPNTKIDIPAPMIRDTLHVLSNVSKFFINLSVIDFGYAFDWGMYTCLIWVLLKQNSAKYFIDMKALGDFCSENNKRDIKNE